jgi:hypothetical protein
MAGTFQDDRSIIKTINLTHEFSGELIFLCDASSLSSGNNLDHIPTCA